VEEHLFNSASTNDLWLLDVELPTFLPQTGAGL
jgi:hypothetical protein